MTDVELTGKKWNAEQQAAALRWYAQKNETTVLTKVPITGPDLNGWGPKCKRHTASVALPSGEAGLVQPFDEGLFTSALSAQEPLRPMLAWAGAGRYGLGWLLAYKAYIERSWEPATPVQPLTLVSPGEDRPNTASAFQAFDVGIVAVDGEAPHKRSEGKGRPAKNDPWENPSPGEDLILQDLWNKRGREGWWLAEVPIGAGAPRRLDAAVIPWPESRHSKAGVDVDEFRRAVADGAPVELIEAKWRPDEYALGQLLGGQHMFVEEYSGHGELSMTACVREPGTEPAQWLYEQHPVRVELQPE